ncbi:sigma-54-dependent Fis family transcriptional regulator [Saccharopolyspora rosea]|uniref:Sigma-54-dependent Fis family transcriptional regulator n=1 Tax=Saccharopolyspora rosea TaxID=524884 RepID=A0ABW3FS72_9PSEU|nr:helix-turn-helix domain-containing protein [Saccharopolyspora rosea]
MPSEPGETALRPEIRLSWHRARISGLAPDTPLHRVRLAEVDQQSRLVAAAAPVLDTVASQLAETGFSVLLADAQSRIVDRRFGQTRLGDALDEVRAVPGSQYLEDSTGTNSLATTYETRRGVFVTGEEHYLEPLKQFCCYGHPVWHPTTGKLEGVLDVTGYARDATPLLGPFLQRAAHDIEQRLLDGSRRSEKSMLAAYQSRTARTEAPVVVLGEGLTLANPAATDLLDPADYVALRSAARGGPARLALASGSEVLVTATAVEGAHGAVLYEFSTVDGQRTPRRRRMSAARVQDQLDDLRSVRGPLLICGEIGSGRTTAARELADGKPVRVHDAVHLGAAGVHAWLARVAVSTGSAGQLTVVENVHLLPENAVSGLLSVLDHATGQVVLTGPPVAELDGEHTRLLSRCPHRVDLPPLRLRRQEIPAMVSRLLAEHHPGTPLRFTPDALRCLARHTWPGNLHELTSVVRMAAERRGAGDLTPADLPAAYRSPGPGRRLSPLEEAERDIIRSALRRNGGNKVRAAVELGIGRTTLYRRIRALSIE